MVQSPSHENKLRIIEQLIILNDDAVFSQIESLINMAMHRPSTSKLTHAVIVRRAEMANKDIRVYID